MTREGRRRLLVCGMAALAIGTLALVEWKARRCVEAGGQFAWLSARCTDGPPIILDRGLRRT